jgi:regulatory protein
MRQRRLYAVPDSPAPSDRDDAGRSAEMDADPEEVARAICLRMLTQRPCTRMELAAELRRRRVPAEAAEAVLGRFDNVGLVDDAAFAAAWVERRRRTSGLSRRALATELRRKGVGDEDVQAAVSTVTEEAERERAAELVARKLPSVRGLDHSRQVNRLVGMLARKGYGAGIAYGVVRDALSGEFEDVDGSD